MATTIDKILQAPPTQIQNELETLRKELDTEVPKKTVDQNLLIATWNLRSFGDLTEKWTVTENDSPKRNLHALRCITEIIQRFDIVALQEVKGNIKSLRHMLKALGTNWSFILTDVTKGDPGNNERMAFIFDNRRVQMSGLASEIVVPCDQLQKINPDALTRQFARTPYAVSFRAGGSPIKKPKTFILVTLHVLYGKNPQQRVPELKAIANWLSNWAKNINAYDHNLIALGDFNIDRKDDLLYQAFTSTGLQVPNDLHQVPRTIFSDPTKPSTEKFYDQIAWFTGEQNMPALSMKHIKSGYFDFTQTALSTLNLTKNQISWRISDHYPLWIEFSLTQN